MSKKTTYVVPEQDRVSAASKLCYSIGFAGKDTFQVIANNYLMMFLMMDSIIYANMVNGFRLLTLRGHLRTQQI